MGKSTKNRKTTKSFDIPSPQISNADNTIPKFPYNGNMVKENTLSFSFSCFDREHKYFDLSSKETHGVIDGSWFLDLFDCLKNVGKMTKSELKTSAYELHPIDWEKVNVSRPLSDESLEYWQFRLNKSKGRVVGFIIDNVFYVVWLDAHHNLTDSAHYEKGITYKRPLSTCEKLLQIIEKKDKTIEHLRSELNVANDLIDAENSAYKMPK